MFTLETIGSLEESLFLLQVYVDSEEEETVEVPRKELQHFKEGFTT